MGQALISGWLEQKILPAKNILVVEPAGLPAALSSLSVVPDAAAIPDNFVPTLILLAVKPQILANVAPHYAKYGDATFLSIAAG